MNLLLTLKNNKGAAIYCGNSERPTVYHVQERRCALPGPTAGVVCCDSVTEMSLRPPAYWAHGQWDPPSTVTDYGQTLLSLRV